MERSTEKLDREKSDDIGWVGHKGYIARISQSGVINERNPIIRIV